MSNSGKLALQLRAASAPCAALPTTKLSAALPSARFRATCDSERRGDGPERGPGQRPGQRRDARVRVRRAKRAQRRVRNAGPGGRCAGPRGGRVSRPRTRLGWAPGPDPSGLSGLHRPTARGGGGGSGRPGDAEDGAKASSAEWGWRRGPFPGRGRGGGGAGEEGAAQAGDLRVRPAGAGALCSYVTSVGTGPGPAPAGGACAVCLRLRAGGRACVPWRAAWVSCPVRACAVYLGGRVSVVLCVRVCACVCVSARALPGACTPAVCTSERACPGLATGVNAEQGPERRKRTHASSHGVWEFWPGPPQSHYPGLSGPRSPRSFPGPPPRDPSVCPPPRAGARSHRVGQGIKDLTQLS